MNLKARYDVTNDKILDCAPGSLFWWHERGHQVTRAWLVYEVRVYRVCVWLGLLGAAVTLVTRSKAVASVAVVLLLCAAGLRFLSEAWAWAYAFWNYRKKSI